MELLNIVTTQDSQEEFQLNLLHIINIIPFTLFYQITQQTITTSTLQKVTVLITLEITL